MNAFNPDFGARMALNEGPALTVRSRGGERTSILRPSRTLEGEGGWRPHGAGHRFKLPAEQPGFLTEPGNPVASAQPHRRFAFFFHAGEVITVVARADEFSRLGRDCGVFLDLYDLEGQFLGRKKLPLDGAAPAFLTMPAVPGRGVVLVKLAGEGVVSGLSVSIEPSAQPTSEEDDRPVLDDEAALLELFDPEWYAAQADLDGADPQALLRHYRQRGARAGMSPSRWFQPNWYRAMFARRGVTRDEALRDYLRRGPGETVAPHALFDSEWYVRHYAPPAGLPPLIDFLRSSGERHPNRAALTAARLGVNELAAPHSYPDDPALWIGKADRAALGSFESATGLVDPGFATAVRSRHGAEAESVLVSIILTAKQVDAGLRDTLDGIAAQQHSRWELLIAGEAAVAAEAQRVLGADRVRAVSSKARPSGRNKALGAAKGAVIAWAEPGERWRPDFLPVMLAQLSATHAAAVHSASVLKGERRRYTGGQIDRAALIGGDPLPLGAVVHRTGSWRFDRELGSDAQRGYLLDLIDDVGSTPAPFIGLDVTPPQPAAGADWRGRAVQRGLIDWSTAGQAGDAGLAASIVLSASGRIDRIGATLEAMVTATNPIPHEIIVVENGIAERDRALLAEWERLFPRIRILPAPHPVANATALNLGAIAAAAAAVVLVEPGTIVGDGWLAPLLSALDEKDVAGAQPIIRYPDGRLCSAGASAPLPGSAFPVIRQDRAPAAAEAIDAVTGGLFVLRRSALVAAGGLDPLYGDALAPLDLSFLLRSRGERLVLVPSTEVMAIGQRAPLLNERDRRRAFAKRWAGAVPVPVNTPPAKIRADNACLAARELAIPIAPAPRERRGPLSIAIKVSASAARGVIAGDEHFAAGLARALEAEGHRVRIDLPCDWYGASRRDDLVLAIRGRFRYQPSPRHLNLLWVISHPDDVDGEECGGFDHVFAASARLARRLARTAAPVPVTALLQCTDPERFKPAEGPDAPRRVVFVGNSRGIDRPLPRTAVEERLPVELYGRDWERFETRALLRGTVIPNEELADVYRGAVVLNDHWADMAEAGILSNRLFDAAACAVPVISDPVEGLAELFDGLVATADKALAPVLAEVLGEAGALRDRRLALAHKIATEHSFAARARTILETATVLLGRKDAGEA